MGQFRIVGLVNQGTDIVAQQAIADLQVLVIDIAVPSDTDETGWLFLTGAAGLTAGSLDGVSLLDITTGLTKNNQDDQLRSKFAGATGQGRIRRGTVFADRVR